MGIFFGPGGIFTKSGNTTFVSGGEDDEDVITHAGNVSFSKRGMMSTCGNTSFMSNGTNIVGNGDSYFCNGKTYTKAGDTLFGSDGKVWSGSGMTDTDARDIIAHDK